MKEEQRDISVLRHSCAHIMAQAVSEIYPEVKLAIGPAIEEGFYYDFDKATSFTPQDLEIISSKMKEIIALDLPFVKEEIKKERALKFLKEKKEIYKVEIIEEIQDEKVSLYKQGSFVDLCKGPHLKSTGKVKYFKLLSVAGAYWRGDEKRQMLQRIYGTAFFDRKELAKYLLSLEEAKKRDHRKIGKDLDLFSIHEEGGPGLIYWHPKGCMIRDIIETFWKKEHRKAGYQMLSIPHLAKIDLWKTSGHWDFYQENMYSPIDIEGQQYIIKPMNCPGHILIYKTKLRSYRDLPIRWAELGTVYRYERSGVLHGLMRVRGFTQDDAHIFCREDQLEEEIISVIEFVLFILKSFGFNDFEVFLSTRPPKYVGTVEEWDKATEALKKALEKVGLAYQVDPGEGVFYGPKVDIKIKDCLKRSWQCSTVQVDFNLPERFDVKYRDKEGGEHTAVMIHRALMGSLERFFGILIEHYAGAFPLWLAPEQVRIITITNNQEEYAKGILKTLKEADIRAEVDLENEKLGYKIRQAQMQKIPYMLVLGQKEAESQTVAVRKKNGENLGQLKIADLIIRLQQEIKEKK